MRRATNATRGLVFPSPVVMLSIIAVAFAAIAFVATRGAAPTEREITPTTSQQPSTAPSTAAPVRPKPKPVVQRAKTRVEVYNNSGITGLAARVGETASGAGWQVTGTDNWYGSVPTNTVYFPRGLRFAAKQLALDLGIPRTSLAVGAMKRDRLTVILVGEL